MWYLCARQLVESLLTVVSSAQQHLNEVIKGQLSKRFLNCVEGLKDRLGITNVVWFNGKLVACASVEKNIVVVEVVG